MNGKTMTGRRGRRPRDRFPLKDYFIDTDYDDWPDEDKTERIMGEIENIQRATVMTRKGGEDE